MGRKIHKLFFKLLRSEDQAKSRHRNREQQALQKEFGSGMGSNGQPVNKM
jgi:superoxide dismutase